MLSNCASILSNRAGVDAVELRVKVSAQGDLQGSYVLFRGDPTASR